MMNCVVVHVCFTRSRELKTQFPLLMARSTLGQWEDRGQVCQGKALTFPS